MDKRKASISKTLKKYYLVFILLTFISGIVAAALSYVIGTLTFRNYNAPKLSAADVAQADYKEINISDIEKLGGWVEIIQNYKVVFVAGEKKDQKQWYSPSELNYPQNGYGKKVVSSFNEGLYSCSTSVFTGNDQNEYVCLVKIPLSNMERSIRNFLNFSNPLFLKERLMCLVVIEGLGVFSLLFVFCVFIFTKGTSRQISLPLSAITNGIQRMSSGEYGTRLDFEAESEFAAIRDVFNFMADRLETAENERKEAEESKRNMIMGISHDLKTPITTVYGYAKALNDRVVDDEEKRRKYLQYISDKAENMTKLIDDLFKYASLDSGKYHLERENDDFAEFVRELIAENFVEISNKGFQLELNIPEFPIMCQFDGKELHRALFNVLSNCLKYNPQGTTLGVSIGKENEEVVLVISDNGIGISKELKDRIFSEFVRGNTARQSDGGSGLGLAITRRIIEMHGGRIEISSDIGKGSTFTIHLPL